MKKFKEFIMRKAQGNMTNFALAFAEGSVQRICFIFFTNLKCQKSYWILNQNSIWRESQGY